MLRSRIAYAIASAVAAVAPVSRMISFYSVSPAVARRTLAEYGMRDAWRVAHNNETVKANRLGRAGAKTLPANTYKFGRHA